MDTQEFADFIVPEEIESILKQRTSPASARVRELLAKAREQKGLTMEEVACLSFVENPELLNEIFSTAKEIKEEIYGNRLVFLRRFTSPTDARMNALTVRSAQRMPKSSAAR